MSWLYHRTMKLLLTSIIFFLGINSQVTAKSFLQDTAKACPILVIGSADGKTQELPVRSGSSDMDPYSKANMKIIVRADTIREDNLAHGEIEKQKDHPLNAYPFVSKRINVACNSVVTVKYFIKSEDGKDYYLKISGENNKVYKEITHRLNSKTEDSETFSFKVEAN